MRAFCRLAPLAIATSGVGGLLVAPVHAQSQAFEVSGEGPGQFGYSVSEVGDIDNDGIDDFVAGAPWIDDDSGEARVVSGADGSVLYTYSGLAPGDRKGEAVCSTGDMNADGFLDFAVSAANPTIFASVGQNTGRVHVYSGMDGSELFQVTGQDFEDNFGVSISGAGDVNGDGRADLIVGATEFVGLKSGFAVVYGLDDMGQVDVHFTVSGILMFDEFGTSVSEAGDHDGDGFGDVLIGARQVISVGYAVVLSGKHATDFAGDNISLAESNIQSSDIVSLIIPGPAEGFTQFGHAVDHVGDITGDGKPDYVIGAPNAVDAMSGNVTGRVHVISGNVANTIAIHDGDAQYDRLGYAVCGLGDVTGDGVPDYAAGAKQSKELTFVPPMLEGPGYVRVYSGATKALHHQIDGFGNAEFGYAIGSGDYNADGIRDVIAGGPTLGHHEGMVAAWVDFDPFAVFGEDEACPGAGGLLPELTVEGDPRPGGALTLSVVNPEGPGVGLIFAGTAVGSTPVLGCTLLTAPVDAPIALVGLDGGGHGSMIAPLSTTMPAGVKLVAQAAVVGPGGMKELATTSGCTVTIQ